MYVLIWIDVVLIIKVASLLEAALNSLFWEWKFLLWIFILLPRLKQRRIARREFFVFNILIFIKIIPRLLIRETNFMIISIVIIAV